MSDPAKSETPPGPAPPIAMPSPVAAIPGSASPAVGPTTPALKGLSAEIARARSASLSHGAQFSEREPWKRINPRDIRASMPFHTRVLASALSSDSDDIDFRGLYNLAALALFVMNLRLVVENLLKYGWLLKWPKGDFRDWPSTWPSLVCALGIFVFPLLAYGIELAAARKITTFKQTAWLHVANCLVNFFVPITVIHFSRANIMPGIFLLFIVTIMVMKLISYAHTSNDLRRDSGDVDDVSQPKFVESPVIAPVVAHSKPSESASDAATDPAAAAGDNPPALRLSSPPASPLSQDGMRLRKRSWTARRSDGKEEEQGNPLFKDKAWKETKPPSESAKDSDSDEDAQQQAKLAAVAPTAPRTPKTTKKQRKAPYEPSLFKLFYFLAAPTLIYQPEYPRTPRIRWRFVARRLVEILFCGGLIVFFVEQYVTPTVHNSLQWLDEHPGQTHKRYFYLLERLFKLAVPNACIWLLGFYLFFHSWLNLTAELLRFGDRLFYKDWWNAASLDVYWRNWNLPVHHWLVRHVYAPALRHGLSSGMAQGIVFFVSAVMHEVLVSVPCHMIRLWAFWGMMGQVPLIAITRIIAKRFGSPVWGNIVFWTTFLVFGQPACILLYAHQYVRTQQLPGLLQ